MFLKNGFFKSRLRKHILFFFDYEGFASHIFKDLDDAIQDATEKLVTDYELQIQGRRFDLSYFYFIVLLSLFQILSPNNFYLIFFNFKNSFESISRQYVEKVTYSPRFHKKWQRVRIGIDKII